MKLLEYFLTSVLVPSKKSRFGYSRVLEGGRAGEPRRHCFHSNAGVNGRRVTRFDFTYERDHYLTTVSIKEGAPDGDRHSLENLMCAYSVTGFYEASFRVFQLSFFIRGGSIPAAFPFEEGVIQDELKNGVGVAMNCGRAARCVSPLESPLEIDTKGRFNQKEADLTFRQNGEAAVQKGMELGKR